MSRPSRLPRWSRGQVGRLLAGLVLAGGLLSGCSDDDGPEASPPPPPRTSPTAAPPAPTPATGACTQLDYDEALSPTVLVEPSPCRQPHTAQTVHVGRLDALLDGHLLAVDAERVQAQVAADCPRRVQRFLGASTEQLRLSVLRAVWFSPTVEQSDAGEDWYRCDVIAVSRERTLAPLTGRLRGILSQPQGRSRWGTCGTAEPGTPRFRRVVCTAEHSWRAVATLDLPGRRYPGAAARSDGQAACEDAAREVADDQLNYRWGYEWPTSAQWQSGQRYAVCWAPD
ncbi:septum formation family protein [Nocardioides pacificus]